MDRGSSNSACCRTSLRNLLVATVVAAGALSAVPSPAITAVGATKFPSVTTGQISAQIGADALIASGYDGSGIDVAVIDTGVEAVPGLDGPDKLLTGPDLSFEAGVPDLYGHDSYGHGTVMASIIAGNDGDGGFQGVAPGARILSVKVADNTGAVDVSQVIAALDWVVEHGQSGGLNVRVINLSYVTDSTQPYEIDPLADAVERAWEAGHVVVVSAGNHGSDTDALGNPANDPYVIAVAAAEDAEAAAFSNAGSKNRRPDVLAPGYRVLGLAAPDSRLAQEHPEAIIEGRYLRGSGTSQAAAVVSGAAALLLDQRPDLTPDQVKALLVIGTVDENGLGRAADLKPFKNTAEYFDLLDEEAAFRGEATKLRMEAVELRAAGDIKNADKAEKAAARASKKADDASAKADKVVVSKIDKHTAEAESFRVEAQAARDEATSLRSQAAALRIEATPGLSSGKKDVRKQAQSLIDLADDLITDAEDLEKKAADSDKKAVESGEKAAKEVAKLTSEVEKIFQEWDGSGLGKIDYDETSGAGMIDVERSASLPTLDARQSHPRSDGSGSLEAARGTSHVTLPDGTTLEGEVTFAGSSWSGSSWSGSSWSGSSWSGSSWSGSSWSGSTWV